MSQRSIVHVITGLGTGGAEMMLLRLLMTTDWDRWRPVVVSLQDQGTLADRISELDVPVITLRMRGSLQAPAALWRLRRELRSLRPSLVQGWMYHGNLAALAGRVLTRPVVPVVWNIRYTPDALELEKRGTAAVIRWGARLSKQVSRIIYNSRAGAARHAQLGYVQTSTEIIPNGLDTVRFAPSPAARATWRERIGATDDAIVIGRIARHHAMKDHATFLQAAARLVTEDGRVRFVLAGEGIDASNGELVELIRALGLGDRVSLLGEVRAVHELTAALDIACSSSAYGEAFPTVLGEAMACGVPCVTTDVGDSAWIVGSAGLVVPPRNPSALAAACRSLVDAGISERQRLGAEGRARVLQEFSLEETAAKYDHVYQAAIAETVETS